MTDREVDAFAADCASKGAEFVSRYSGGQIYMDAAVADMGTEYIEVAAGMSTPVMYIAVIIGVLAASAIGERLTEKILKIKE